MTFEVVYFKELEAFLQILLLGSVLSFVVCFAVESLKATGIKKDWFYLAASMVLSGVFGFGFAKTFTQMTNPEAVTLCVCLWLGSQGFYDNLKQSDGWLGKYFVTLSERAKKEYYLYTDNLKDGHTDNMNKITDIIDDDRESDVKETEIPKAEKRNVNSNQIKVLVNDLRIRKAPMGDILGYAEKNKYYTFTGKEVKDGITWYKAGDCYIGDSGDGDVAVCNADDCMIFPLKEYVWVSTKFSKDHPAVDFGWSRNYGGASQKIVAPYDMTVAKTGYDSTVGNYIYAQATYEGKKYTFRFIHLSAVSVSKGDKVKQGTVIGRMGNTGASSAGAHLHFDILDGHRTSLPSDRYENSNDAVKMCYAKDIVVDSDTLSEFDVLKV